MCSVAIDLPPMIVLIYHIIDIDMIQEDISYTESHTTLECESEGLYCMRMD